VTRALRPGARRLGPLLLLLLLAVPAATPAVAAAPVQPTAGSPAGRVETRSLGGRRYTVLRPAARPPDG
jgi:hypothetical protein